MGTANELDLHDIDFAEIRRWDTLVSKALRTLNDLFNALVLKVLENKFHMSRRMDK